MTAPTTYEDLREAISRRHEELSDRLRRIAVFAVEQPNEIALNILLAGFTIIFLVVCATLLPFSLFSVAAAGQGAPITITVLVALLVCLIPTTIGGLLSAIGIAGMDRMIQRNVIALSGRAVEAAGDVDVLLLDKTGTITFGNRQASTFLPAPGVSPRELADAARLASLADETPEGRSIVALADKAIHAPAVRAPDAEYVPFTAQTRMSGIDIDGQQIRKGAVESVIAFLKQRGIPETRPEIIEAKSIADSFALRRTALMGGIPYFTTVSGILAAVGAIAELSKGELEVAPLQSYFLASDQPAAR